jgi:FKBP-type peptidyl-prolyl cis-trans isomerase
MKQAIFTLLLLSAISLVSCRKDKIELDIKQYDSVQIKNYIAANALTDMVKDTTGGDTTGMWYKILSPGSGKAYDYPDQVYLVYTLRSFDGSYISSDTINNHFYDYLGHMTADNFPKGLQSAVHNLLKYPDASMRLLIPSHLAFGVNGSGQGSSTVANNKIKGNACLDYYVHAVGISSVPKYDDQVIQTYMAFKGLTGYTKTTSGLYYKVLTPGTSSDPITTSSTITCTYTGQIFNDTIFDGAHNGTNTATFDIGTLRGGVVEGLTNYATAGTKISLLIPSGLGYGSGVDVGPQFSCLRFTFQVITVTP